MKVLSKAIFIIAILIATSSLSFGQRSFVLKGQIMDGGMDEPLMAAAVSIKGKPVGTATDFNGKFKFEILKEHWEDTIVVSMLGFMPYKLSVADAQKLPNKNLEITLQETAFQLDMAEIGAPIILKNIFFDFNKHQLLPTSFPELEKLYNYLQKNETVVIEISGHTDSIGTDVYNAALSEARASSVMAYLEEKGIDQTRMVAKGYGKARPVVSNDTEKGQAMNRRVEFTVISKGKIVNTSQMPDTTRKKEEPRLEAPKIENDDIIVLTPPTIEIENQTDNIEGDENEIEIPVITIIDDESEKSESIKAIAAEYSVNEGFNGAIMVFQDGEILYKDGVGFANLSATRPNTLTTQFYLGELSEQFTTALILKAVKSNKLDLEVPIKNYLGDLPKIIGERVTILQLITHTSGLCKTSDLNSLDLCFVPNASQNYSEINFVLLGEILENIHKENFSDIIEKQIINPLGLKNTIVHEPMQTVKGLAKGYRKDGGKLEEVVAEMDNQAIAANGIITTVTDLFLWQKALKNNEWFSGDLQVLMEAKVVANQTFAGEVVQVVMGDKVLEVILAKATINGHQTLILKTPSNKSVIVIASNIETANLQPLYRDILKVLFL
ncbi:MAG: serine hydrolase [Saprospiraceae bacterium]